MTSCIESSLSKYPKRLHPNSSLYAIIAKNINHVESNSLASYACHHEGQPEVPALNSSSATTFAMALCTAFVRSTWNRGLFNP